MITLCPFRQGRLTFARQCKVAVQSAQPAFAATERSDGAVPVLHGRKGFGNLVVRGSGATHSNFYFLQILYTRETMYNP